MLSLLRRVVRTLRSRWLAIGLIAALAVYAIMATLIPLGAPDNPRVRAWAANHPVAESFVAPLDLHRPYTSPLFLTFVVLLAASTAACAYERSRRADALMRSMLEVPPASVERLRARPQLAFSLEAGADSRSALVTAADGLKLLGLRVRVDGDSAHGRSGLVGLLGSPVFHWALVLLMLVVAAGQDTRSEGFMALPLGVPVAEQHANYLQIDEGPLFREHHTGIQLDATEISHKYTSGGVSYGASPLITASRDGVVIASGYVHPNSPLRAGPLLIHMVKLGPAVTLSLESSAGVETGREVFTLDRSTETTSGTKPQTFILPPAEAGSPGITARVQVLIQRQSALEASVPVTSRAILQTMTTGSESFGTPVTVSDGEAIDLPGGQRLRVAKVSDWVRVSIANDWSVPFIYGLLITAIIGLALAVLVPTRRASVLLVEGEDGYGLHLGTWHARGDTLFKRRVIEVVRAAAAGEVEDQ